MTATSSARDKRLLQPGHHRIRWETFERVFRPIRKIDQGESGPDVFEAFGQEYQFVRAVNAKHIWTWVSGDNGKAVLVSGPHIVNRENYAITEVAVPDGVSIEVFGYV